jgi:putative endonuclease
MNAKSHPTKNDVGTLGEALVVQWLSQQGASVLQQRWRCRWGEIDAIAHFPKTPENSEALAFVEVKTRRRHNWDSDGRQALSPQKCDRLWKTARHFLARFPQYAELPCRFDLALVRYHLPIAGVSPHSPPQRKKELTESIRLGQPFLLNNIQLTLHAYLLNVLTDR